MSAITFGECPICFNNLDINAIGDEALCVKAYTPEEERKFEHADVIRNAIPNPSQQVQTALSQCLPTRCAHVFHKHCFLKALRTDATCPTCRDPIRNIKYLNPENGKINETFRNRRSEEMPVAVEVACGLVVLAIGITTLAIGVMSVRAIARSSPRVQAFALMWCGLIALTAEMNPQNEDRIQNLD